MALADSGRAIGAVTQLLHDRLMTGAGTLISDVTVGRPEPGLNQPSLARLNLFLYEVIFDGSLRNVSLEEDQPPPLWLALRYMLTAFDTQGESDTVEAHAILGRGAQILQDLNFLSLDGLGANDMAALADIPDKLKITFQDASVDLLSKVMQGSEEHYRTSLAFEIRPVMIAPGQPPSYSLLVGINYQTDSVVGEEGIRIPVLPTLGPALTALVPDKVDLGGQVTLLGTDLGLEGLSVMFGPAELPVVAAPPGRLVAEVSASLDSGETISAGNHPVSVVLTLPGGRRRSSNLLVGGLRPRLDSATPSGLAAGVGGTVTGTLDLAGALLGSEDDDVVVALYRDGAVAAAFETFVRPPGPPFQQALQLQITAANALPAGSYLVILRVNGQQAPSSPLVDLTP